VTSGAKSNALGAFVLTLGLRAVPWHPPTGLCKQFLTLGGLRSRL
jgi:hypothetical protein